MTVPDPELEIRGQGGGAVSQETFFGPQFGLKIRGRTPGPLPWIRQDLLLYHRATRDSQKVSPLNEAHVTNILEYD